ncbi:MAG: hypothetical protein ACOCP8_00345 [archaeon]
MKKYKIKLPELGKLEFGNVKQINTIKKYQELLESEYWDIEVDVIGKSRVTVKAKNENEIHKYFNEQINNYDIKDNLDIDNIDIHIRGKKLPPKKRKILII